MSSTRQLTGRRPRLLLALSALLLLVSMTTAGCDKGTPNASPSPDPEPTSSTTSPPPAEPGEPAPQATTRVRVYFANGEKLYAVSREIPKTGAVAAAALTELLEGPTAAEKQDADITTSIPAKTTLLGVTIDDGIATVDLSPAFDDGGGTLSMMMRLGQVVYTVTQFPSVKSVQFEIGGNAVEAFGGEGLILDAPQRRADYEDVTPLVLIESPAFGEPAAPPIRVRGTSNVFEGAFFVEAIAPDGKKVVDKESVQTSGSGDRGAFDVTLGKQGDDIGSIVAYYFSPEDGKKVVFVEQKLSRD